MGVIEEMRKKPWLKYAVMGAVVLAIGINAYHLWPEKKLSQTLAYFSDDDGKTWYADNRDNIPPYDHNGKQAVRAIVFSYANGSKQFCGYLLRYSPAVRKSIMDAVAAGAAHPPALSPYAIAYGMNFVTTSEVKAAGSSEPWVPSTSDKGRTVMSVKSPDSSELDSVVP